ncbi:MAG: alpha/beta fold hydrolase [Pseudomonadota bacterium]
MGEPVVFLPGMMCDARLFGPQTAALSGSQAVHHAPITGGETIGDLALDVLSDAPPRFALAGLSMGGIVAMEVIARAPERVTRLALLDTNHRAETPEKAAARAPQITAVRAGRLVEIMRDEMKPNYLAPGPARADTLDLVMEMAVALGPEVFVRQSHALRTRPDQSAALRGVRVPTLVLCGRHDLLCPVARHEEMAGLIPGADLVVIDGAGHLPTLETPEAVSEALVGWMGRPPSP